jgi:hypothetical protein
MHCMHADLSVFRGIQGEIWDGKGCVLQIAQMETEQAQNGPSIILSRLIPNFLFVALQFKLQVEESLLANLYILFPPNNFTLNIHCKTQSAF